MSSVSAVMSRTTSISLVGVQPLPFLDELLGDVDHARVVGLHGAGCRTAGSRMLCALLRFGSWVSAVNRPSRDRACSPQRAARASCRSASRRA